MKRPHIGDVSHPAPGRSLPPLPLRLDPGTAAALTSLGVTPGVIAPASATSAGLSFPITDSPLRALHTGTITHSGGISLTAGSTQVDLTDFGSTWPRAPTSAPRSAAPA